MKRQRPIFLELFIVHWENFGSQVLLIRYIVMEFHNI